MGEIAQPDIDTSDLEWIKLRKMTDEIANDETTAEKFVRKFKENPFVPIGCFATTMCLTLGLWEFRQGRSARQQVLMRARVAAQGFTIFAFIFGIYLSTDRKNV